MSKDTINHARLASGALPAKLRPSSAGAGKAAMRRSWPVLSVFVGIVCLQLAVTVLSINVMASVRAYVTGESIYSKAQKDAQFHLLNYAETRNEDDYEQFTRSLTIPVGDRLAREEMQKPEFDKELARRSYLAGGNHPADIAGAITLFRWLHRTPLMSSAIQTWTQGDQLVEQLRLVGERAHQKIQAGDLQSVEVRNLRTQVMAINKELTPLEARFAAQLSDGAREAEQLLFWFNLTMALVLGLSGSAFVRRSVRLQLAAEGEVRLRRESLQGILDSAAEGLFGIDADGKCIFINRSALHMLGYKRASELLGMDMRTVLRHTNSDGTPRTPAQSWLSRAATEPRELHLSDETFWRRDGTSFPVEFWSHPRLQSGSFAGAVCTFFDISDRVKMREALRRGEVRIAGLVDAVKDGVMTFGTDERVVLFNRAAERLFGVSAVDAIGCKVDRFIPLADRRLPLSSDGTLHLDFVESGRVREFVGRRASGAEFPLEASISTLDTDEGTLTTMVMRDVTELQIARKETQAINALRAANQAKTDFLSRMSHELRTPLNAVLGFSQLIRMDKKRPPDPEHVQQLKLIESAGSHLLALVNDVLDLSRVESGQMPVTLISVNLRSAVEEALSMVVPLARATQVKTWVAGHEGDLITRGFDEQDDISAVLADPLRLRQVLVNLLSNAIKYNRRGGEVRVSWQLSDDKCTLAIEDDGVGISSQHLGRLFEPFNRLGAEHSTVEGTGIGLVLSRRLAELMGGQLHVESLVDVGTKVSLTLDRAESTDTAEDPMGSPSQHGALERPLHVLYAEDNPVNVEIVRQVMTYRPSVVFDVAQNGAEAFRMARTTRPDLLLVDMNLGDMTGLELAKALHGDPATSGIRLVALSADALEEQIAVAMASGFDGYLTKPIDFRELLNVVDGKSPRRPHDGPAVQSKDRRPSSVR